MQCTPLYIESVEREIYAIFRWFWDVATFIFEADKGKIQNHLVCHTIGLLVCRQHLIFSKVSKYEAEADNSMVSFIWSSLGFMESKYEWKCSLFIDETSSIYLNVELKATARGLFFCCSSYWMNSVVKEYTTSQFTKAHSCYPWKFQQPVGGLLIKDHLFNIQCLRLKWNQHSYW
jgi:hypothetical protein